MHTTKHTLILLILTTVLLNSAHAKLHPNADDPYVSGEFVVMYGEDPMSGDVVSVLILSAEFPDGDRKPVFAVGLTVPDGQVVISYAFGKVFVGDSDREVLVRYRVGKNPASGYQYWPFIGPDRDTAAVIMGIDESRELFGNMNKSDEIIFEVTDPYDREIIRDTFSLRGFTAAFTRAVYMFAALKGERS